MPEIAIVGDIHGDLAKLEGLLARRELHDRHLIFVGDYVNRGPHSRQVLDLLIALRGTWPSGVTLLMGNHERALLDYLRYGDFVAFAAYGGMATIRSYVGVASGDVLGHFRSAVPPAHVALLRDELTTHFEDDEILVSHCGYDPSKPDDRSEKTMTLGSFPALFDPDSDPTTRTKRLVVFGHYVQRDLRPYARHGLVCVDTGCGTIGGPLTALLVPEQRTISQ